MSLCFENLRVGVVIFTRDKAFTGTRESVVIAVRACRGIAQQRQRRTSRNTFRRTFRIPLVSGLDIRLFVHEKLPA